MTVLKDLVAGTSNPADMGAKHVAISILKKQGGTRGQTQYGRPPPSCQECNFYLDGDHEHSPIGPIHSFDSPTYLILKTKFQALGRLVAGLQASTAGAELLTEDSRSSEV
eukprot:2244544-Amphidinium_carterae.1